MGLKSNNDPTAPRLVLGLMSGTSLDGLDMGLFQIEGTGDQVKMRQMAFGCTPYPDKLRQKIRQSFKGDTELICRLNVELGQFYAQESALFLSQHSSVGQVDLVGSHGQTIYHVPGHSSLQMGDPSFLAEVLKVPVVYDFRSADIAAGGHGAPLVPYLDRLFFRSTSKNRVLQNLGGIGNLSYLPKQTDQPIIAFDTGPANGVLNELAHHLSEGAIDYDKDGEIGASGVIQTSILGELMENPYFRQPPPKSTGREDFGYLFVQELLKKHPGTGSADMMATLSEWVAQSLKISYQLHLPEVDQVFLTGGGALNPDLVARIKQAIQPIALGEMPGTSAFDADSKEAAAFALFAHERLNNHPTNLPEVTGANRSVCLGKIAFPT